MAATAYKPAISVSLTKVIDRRSGDSDRFTRVENEIDLTPFLGDESSVMVTRSVYAEAGAFSITFADQPDKTLLDSLYGLIEPMDAITIRMARSPHEYAGRGLPVVMRGFVSQVTRNQAVGGNGVPARTLTVAGQDMAKILSAIQIFYESNYTLGQNLLSSFRLSANHEIEFAAFLAGEWVQAMVDQIVTPYLDAMWLSSATDQAFQLQVDSSVTEGTISPYGYQPYEGSLWGLMRQFSDPQWNELFVEDREAGPFLVYRPHPFKDLRGRMIGGAADPGTVEIGAAAVQSISVTRSDRNVANYYWVNAPRSELAQHSLLRMLAFSDADDYFLQDHQNCLPDLYGIKKMEAQTQHGETSDRSIGMGLTVGAQETANAAAERWVTGRRRLLAEFNRDNVVLEDGSIKARGDERLRPGVYVSIAYDDAYRPTYYITGAQQVYRPYRGWETQLTVTRGTGFVDRSALGRSPYLYERGKSP